MNPEEEGLIPPKPSVKAPANFTSPDELYKELEDSVRKYHPSDDLSLIRKAYEVALNSHGDQRRRSGEPYIIHPLCVAIILAELELDKESIAAGLLHDVLEDTPVTLKELIGLFGEEIAFLVDGVTKLTQINWDMDKIEIQAENLRKMFLVQVSSGSQRRRNKRQKKHLRFIRRLHHVLVFQKSRQSLTICLLCICTLMSIRN